jgi:hypothetical protein
VAGCGILWAAATLSVAASLAIGLLLLSGGPPLWGPVDFEVQAWMVGAAIAVAYLAVRPVRRDGQCAARILGFCSLSIVVLLVLCYLCDQRISPEPAPNETWTVDVLYMGHAGIVPELLEFPRLCFAVVASLLTGMGALYFGTRPAPAPRARSDRGQPLPGQPASNE